MPEPPRQARTGENRYVTVAYLVRAQGNRGEVAAELESDDAAMLRLFREVELWDGAGQRRAARIQAIWPHKKRLILKFEGVETIDQAERLAGWLVQIPAAQRPAAPAGRFYLSDLAGCRVLEARSGRRLGEVTEILETGAAPLLQVQEGAREILIPFAAAICVEINPGERMIRVELPEGLEELNRS